MGLQLFLLQQETEKDSLLLLHCSEVSASGFSVNRKEVLCKLVVVVLTMLLIGLVKGVNKSCLRSHN